MPTFRIALKPDAVQDLSRLKRYVATTILDHIERYLRHEPARVSRSRIKRLRGPQPADYRLRVGAYRAFYRIAGEEVQILRVMHKHQTREFYREEHP
jgi:mRNA-degrading endonuclease RelE of RelBE toxin-antitoxin system